MTFDELTLVLESDSKDFDKLFNQIKAFSEASYVEYKTNLKQADLKVIQESGTDEDLTFLEAEASDGFIVRSAKTIQKMIEEFIEWNKKVAKHIKEFFTGKATTDTLNAAKEAAENNPKLKGTKVDVTNIDGLLKNCDVHEAKIDKKIAGFKAKKFRDSDDEELDNIQKSFDDNHSKIRKTAVAIGVGALIALIVKHVATMDKVEKDAISMKDLNIKFSDDPKEMERYVNAVAYKIRLEQEKSNVISNFLQEATRKIREVIRSASRIGEKSIPDDQLGNWPSAKKNKLSKKQQKKYRYTTASVSDTDEYLDTLVEEFEESQQDEFNAENYLLALESEIDSRQDNLYDMNIESSVESDALNHYLECMEEELFGRNEGITAEEYLEYMEEELFGDITTESVTAEEYLDSLESLIFN